MTDQELDLSKALTELLYGDESAEPLEEALDRLITPHFVQRINGQEYQRAAYTAHVREMRRMVVGGGGLRVLEQFSSDTGTAGRYLFTMVPADRPPLRFESHIFARVEDGRIARLVEVSRQIGDDEKEPPAADSA
ncbi:nuclear transport factor 2 family protein [Streptomyces iconiensis]|uniref:Nuclear transport factor 2 family protein n=1 Tax=Streptomyces iconiensis TaxID=1384038 RepID=A0ABT7A7C5_9ACTN|nr:nuclear transport factor 2 family protein [Streptomyces iconiensis]MDJ1137228.1 nuclear transport factor 2 family protein [Streptomyces iconiensis]